MHLGNVYCAVLSWLSARRKGGRWLLRIEDLDPQRSRREYAVQIMDDLQWLGLEWDEEPVWQSERTELYAEYFGKLREAAMVYPCYCRRADLLAASAPHNSDGQAIYAGTCRPGNGGNRLLDSDTGYSAESDRLMAYGTVTEAEGNGVRLRDGRAPSWRVAVEDEEVVFEDMFQGRVSRNLAREVGDFIVRRSDGVYAYQLAVVVDDALTGVTEVVRGEDLLTSAAQQIFLYRKLGLPYPIFGHIPLLCAADGRRLCKRDKDMDMGVLRSRHTPAELLGIIAQRAGLQTDEEPRTLAELTALYAQLH